MITVNEVASKAIRFCIMDGGREIARAWLYIIKNDLREVPYGLLEDVWVDPDCRNNGHASTLVRAAITRAKELACYKLIATSRLEREKVHKLYKELGFISHGYEFRMDFLLEGER